VITVIDGLLIPLPLDDSFRE